MWQKAHNLYGAFLAKLPVRFRDRRVQLLGLLIIAFPLIILVALTQQELRNRASGLPETPTTPPNPQKSPINWYTPYASLQADDFYIQTDSKKYTAQNTQVSVHSDPGTASYTTLEATWQENGTEMRLFMYFSANGTSWQTTEIRTYNGQTPGEWVYYSGEGINNLLTAPFVSQVFEKTSLAISTFSGLIHFENLMVSTFINNPPAVPTATPTMTPTNTPTRTPSPTQIPTITPKPVIIAPGNGNGLKGYYYRNKNLTSLDFSRIDSTINFTFGRRSPSSQLGIDTFSIRWLGYIQARSTAEYTLYTLSDDGVRLWVNNKLLINNWSDHGSTQNSARINFIAGKLYPIRLEYYENKGNAVIKLMWSSFGIPKQIIPKTQLYLQ